MFKYVVESNKWLIVGMLLVMLSTMTVAKASDSAGVSFYLNYSTEGVMCGNHAVVITAIKNGTTAKDFVGTVRLNVAQDGNTQLSLLDDQGKNLVNNQYTFQSSDQGKAHLKLSKIRPGLLLFNGVQLLDADTNRFESVASRYPVFLNNEEEEEGSSDQADLPPMYFYESGFQITHPENILAGEEFNLTIQAVNGNADGTCERNLEYVGDHEISVRKTRHQQFDEAYVSAVMETRVLFPDMKSSDGFIPLSDDTLTRSYLLNFGDAANGGQAVLKVRYDGIGIFSFNASDLREELSGESSLVSITPAKLKINQVTSFKNGPLNLSSDPTNLTDALGASFAVAGENFGVEVVALNIKGEPVLGFGYEIPKEDLSLNFKRILPEQGVDGTLSVCWHNVLDSDPACKNLSSPQKDPLSKGVWATVNYSEVGKIQLIAHLADGLYWQHTVPQETEAEDGEPSHTKMVGRFIPAKIVVIDSEVAPKFTAACAVSDTAGFTYLGQSILQSKAAIPTVIIRAENVAGEPLKNYSGNLWRLESDFHPELISLNELDHTELMNTTVSLVDQSKDSSFIELLRSESLISGEETGAGYTAFQFVTATNLQYTKPENGQFVAPFEAKIGLNYYLKEKDGVSIYRPNQAEPLTVLALPSDRDKKDEHWAKLSFGSQDGIEFLHGKTMYQGRLYLSNASRAPLLPMQMSLMMQYYDGRQFVRNTQDNCTAFDAAPQIIEASFESQKAELNILSKQYASNLSMTGDAVDGRFINGQRLIKVDNAAYTKNNSEVPPYGYMIIQLPIDPAQSWLAYPWEDDRDYPEARASIGIWEGDAPVIFKTESYR